MFSQWPTVPLNAHTTQAHGCCARGDATMRHDACPDPVAVFQGDTEACCADGQDRAGLANSAEPETQEPLPIQPFAALRVS